jgi:hypothetical protein
LYVLSSIPKTKEKRKEGKKKEDINEYIKGGTARRQNEERHTSIKKERKE